MLNSVIFMGRLVADPELRTTPNGVSVTSFRIAVDRPFQRERTADFFDVVAWRREAEFITKYFHKGNMICVQGYMTTRSYTDKNGVNRTAYELVAQFTGEKRGDAPAAVPSAPADPAPAASYSSGDKGDFAEIAGDDDLPF